MRIVNPVGKKGEELAVKYLKGKGYKILEQNFRKHYGEIDIIAITPDKQILVFVEVKTRTSTQFGTPLEAITPWKLKSLLKTAQLYAFMFPHLPQQLRIDAISIVMADNAEPTIEHMESISGS